MWATYAKAPAHDSESHDTDVFGSCPRGSNFPDPSNQQQAPAPYSCYPTFLLLKGPNRAEEI